MKRNDNVIFEDRYKTFDDRIVWNLPIFYDPSTKTHGFFVVDTYAYNADGSIDDSTITTTLYYNYYPTQEEEDWIRTLKENPEIDLPSNSDYIAIEERRRIHKVIKDYTNEHPMSLKPWDTINDFLQKKSQEDYDKIHTLEYETMLKKSEIAYDRWVDECSGLLYRNCIVYTDEVSQNKLLAAAVYANANPSYTCMWKCHNGKFLELDRESLNELGTLIRAHVQACYEREEEVLRKLSKCTHRDQVKDIYYEEVHENLVR